MPLVLNLSIIFVCMQDLRQKPNLIFFSVCVGDVLLFIEQFILPS